MKYNYVFFITLFVSSLINVRTEFKTQNPYIDYSCLHKDSWIINNEGHYNTIFSSLTDVISASMNDLQYEVTSKGIPNYDRVVTEDDINNLNSRPFASFEFNNGKTTAAVGNFYQFGDSLGYKTSYKSNFFNKLLYINNSRTNEVEKLKSIIDMTLDDTYPSSTPTRQPSNQPSDQPTTHPTVQPSSSPTSRPSGGYFEFMTSSQFYSCDGYIPPSFGPSCPNIRSRDTTDHFNIFPAKEIGNPSPIGVLSSDHRIGRAVNGIEFRGWNTTYNSRIDGITSSWKALSPEVDFYSMDICRGSISSQIYHHHSYPSCLADKLNDHGDNHSPLYGFAFDGYPIYGPYHAKDTLAVSCWQKRDYNSSETGCPDGLRSCRLVDQYDNTKGVYATSQPGPLFNASFQSRTGSVFTSKVGVFYEDYFFNSSCASQGGEYLNEFNGHSHDHFGFHYHTTITSDRLPAFPYIIGPKYYGCILSRENSMCSKSDGVKPWHSRCLSDDVHSDDFMAHHPSNPVLAQTTFSTSFFLVIVIVTLLSGVGCGMHLKKYYLDLIEKHYPDDEVLEDDVEAGLVEVPAIYIELTSMSLAEVSEDPDRSTSSNLGSNIDSTIENTATSETNEKRYIEEYMVVGSIETAALLQAKQDQSTNISYLPITEHRPDDNTVVAVEVTQRQISQQSSISANHVNNENFIRR